MQITHAETGVKLDVIIEAVSNEDFNNISKAKFFFNWNTEKKNRVYKLKLRDGKQILGLISLMHFEEEQRFEIKLLAVEKKSRGQHREFEGIAENLIAYACREVVKGHGADGCISLLPKTKLKAHYIKKYGMLDAGWQLFLEGKGLFKILRDYKI